MIAEVINNGELSGGVEPKKQDGPNSDAVKVKNKQRKRGESEASENVKEKMPQLKKKRKRQKKKKPNKKVENGKINEEGLDHKESGSTGLQAVKTDESIVRKNVETSLNVYVGGIPYYSTEDDIRSYFEGFGTITYMDCMTFPDSEKSRGFAIITYKTEAAAKRSLALDGFDLGGVFLKVQPYKSAIVNKLPKFSPSVVDGYNRVYIGNLSPDTTEVDLWKLFADCAVTSIRFGEDKETREFKGYAHVDFADGLSLHTALKLDQTLIYERPVRISCKNVPWTRLIFLPKDNQEDSGKKGNTTKLESTTNYNEVDKINVSVVENQVTGSGTNNFSSKIRWRACYKCREHGHLLSACPKKLAANLTIPGQMIVSSENKGFGTALMPLPKDNQEDIGKKRKFTDSEAAPRDQEIDRSTVSLVVENQVTSCGTYAFSSKIWKQTCYKCRECGHLSSSCPKTLAADSTNSDNHDDSGKGNFTVFEATPRDNEVDQSSVGAVIENQVTSSGSNALSSKRRKRTCYKCRKRGHLLSSCLKKLVVDSTNPDNHDDSGKENFTMFETTPRDNEVDQSKVSVVAENQVTSSGANALSSKRRKQICYKCRKGGHLSSSCPNKLAVDSTNPDNHDDSGKGIFTMFETTPRDNEVDQSNDSVVVENQVTSSGVNALSSKRRKRICYKCRKLGHLSSSCPKKLVVDSTNPGRKILQSNVSVVENQVTSNGRNAQSSKIRKRTCYKCRERGHLLSSCPMNLVADSTNPVTAGEHHPIHWRGCTPPVGFMPIDMTSVQGSVRSTLVRWLRPPYPWIKLNTDGSFDGDTGVASGGGLIRDHFGNLQLAFYMPLEATSSFDAELQALLHGLHLAKQFNRPIWIELDALQVVLLLESGRPGAWQTHHTLMNIRALMTQIQTWITHIFREGNRPADYMATMGVGSHALHLVYPHLAPKNFMDLVVMDQIGYPSFRVR